MSKSNPLMNRSISFMSPSNRGLHPHVVRETGQEVSNDAYEKENSVLDVTNRDYLTSSSLGEPPAVKDSISDFISKHPLLSVFGAIAVGAVLYKSMSDSGEGDGFDDGGDLPVRIRNPRSSSSNGNSGNTSCHPASPATVFIQSPQVAQPMLPVGYDSAKIIDAQVKCKPAKKRKRPSVVQVRDNEGKFTSKTVRVRKKK